MPSMEARQHAAATQVFSTINYKSVALDIRSFPSDHRVFRVGMYTLTMLRTSVVLASTCFTRNTVITLRAAETPSTTAIANAAVLVIRLF